MADLPSGVKEVINLDQLSAIVNNPQVLINEDASVELQGMFEGLGARGDTLFEQLISTLQNALNSALVQVFLVFLIISIIGMIVNFFLKGIPPHVIKADTPAPENKD